MRSLIEIGAEEKFVLQRINDMRFEGVGRGNENITVDHSGEAGYFH